MKKSALLAVVAVVLGFARLALAGAVGGLPPDFSIAVASSAGGDHLNLTPTGTLSPDGTFSGNASGTTPSFDFSATFAVNADPTISGSFTLTNLSPSLQIFTVGATLGGVSIPSATTFHGSYGAATYTDTNDDTNVKFASPTLAAPGTLPFMTALIDGSAVAVIGGFANDQSGTGGSGMHFFATQGPEAFGPSAGPAVTGSIGTAFAFALSPGDTVSTPFEFVVVPEPAALSSFAIVFALFLSTFAQKKASRLD